VYHRDDDQTIIRERVARDRQWSDTNAASRKKTVVFAKLENFPLLMFFFTECVGCSTKASNSNKLLIKANRSSTLVRNIIFSQKRVRAMSFTLLEHKKHKSKGDLILAGVRSPPPPSSSTSCIRAREEGGK